MFAKIEMRKKSSDNFLPIIMPAETKDEERIMYEVPILLCSLVIVVPLIFAPILLFLYSQILVLIANSEFAKQTLIQFIFLFVSLICLLDMLALVIISVIGWLCLVVMR